MKPTRYFTLLLLFLGYFGAAIAQDDSVKIKQWLATQTQIVRSIEPSDEDYSDLQPLKTMIGDNRIVMLGEQTMGDGATMLAKTRLVKFLHREMGFEVLVFENGIYDLYRADKEIQGGTSVDIALRNSLYPVWTDSREFQPMIEYLEQQRAAGKPLTLAGFDTYQNGTYSSETLIEDLGSFLRKRVPELFNDTMLYELDEVISELAAMPKTPAMVLGNMSLESASPNLFTNAKDSANYYRHNEKIFEALRIVPNLYPGQKNEVLYWQQILTSINKCVQIELDAKHGVEHPAQNPRDWQMAKNLMFIEKLYANKKIMVWGANYHFINNIESLKYKQLKAAYPMGEIANEMIASDGGIFTIAFTAARGKYGWNNIPARELMAPPPGSIEGYWLQQGTPYGYVDLRGEAIARFRYYAAPLYYVPIRGNWARVFDALFYIRDMTPATPSRRNDDSDTKFTIIKTIPLTGEVKDATTHMPIVYATLSIVGTATGTITNTQGKFEVKIPLDRADRMLQIAAIGYETIQLNVLESIMENPFISLEMKRTDYTIETVVVDGVDGNLTPNKIINRTLRRLNKNYFRNPYSMELFYRGWRKDNNQSTYLLESALDLYDSKGNKRSDLRGLLRERNLRVNQIKRVNYEDWQGRVQEYVADMSQQDFIRSKNNILSKMRLRYYDIELENITWFDDDEVFVIKYKCNRPSFYTTGYEDVSSYEGRIYIKQTDYAIVKNETTVAFNVSTTSVGGRATQLTRNVKFVTIYRKFEDHYFLNYSRQSVDIVQSSKKVAQLAKEQLLVEMLVTNIETAAPKVFKGRISDLDPSKVAYNKEYWENTTIMLEAIE